MFLNALAMENHPVLSLLAWFIGLCFLYFFAIFPFIAAHKVPLNFIFCFRSHSNEYQNNIIFIIYIQSYPMAAKRIMKNEEKMREIPSHCPHHWGQ